jgi:hypothetical protein
MFQMRTSNSKCGCVAEFLARNGNSTCGCVAVYPVSDTHALMAVSFFDVIVAVAVIER